MKLSLSESPFLKYSGVLFSLALRSKIVNNSKSKLLRLTSFSITSTRFEVIFDISIKSSIVRSNWCPLFWIILDRSYFLGDPDFVNIPTDWCSFFNYKSRHPVRVSFFASNTAYTLSGNSLTYIPSNNGSYSLITTDRIQFDYSY